MKASKKQKVLDTGLDVVSHIGTKTLEELAINYLGDGARIFTSSAGVILRSAIKSTLQDFLGRVWSPGEQNKLGIVIESAILEINARLDGGAQPRDDGFFTDQEDGRAKAEEILEGVLLRARDQHEEKKLVYFGYFYANVAFRPDIPASLANYFIKTGNALSYRQFVLLRHIADSGNVAFNAEPIRGRRHALPDLMALKREEMELHSPGEFGGYGLINAIASYQEVVSDLGRTFVDLFNLRLIHDEDIRELRQLLVLCANSPLVSTDQ